MSVVVKILEIDETLTGNAVTIGIPDENGNKLVLAVTNDDLSAMKEGASYTLGFVPLVTADHPDANAAAAEAAPTVSTLVPVDHPLVIDSGSAFTAVPAGAADVVVPDAQPAPDSTVTDTTEGSGQ